MFRRRAFAYSLIVAAIVGSVLVVLALTTAFGEFKVRGRDYRDGSRARMYACGTLVSPTYPRNLAPRRALNIPPPLLRATNQCEAIRSQRSRRALTFLAIGTMLIVVVLAIPAFLRHMRRRRHRPRKTYRV
jgi:hypothetical protein